MIRLSSRRLSAVVVALLVALLAGLALAACGDDDSGDSTTTATSSSSPEQAYAEGLADAATAAFSYGQAITSGASDEDVADDIRSANSDWESAIASIDDLDLSGSLASQRNTLVDDTPAFTDAWGSVADEWESSSTNGALQLVQRRGPILDGLNALQAAITGALSEAGSAVESTLESAQSQLTDALSEITTLRP